MYKIRRCKTRIVPCALSADILYIAWHAGVLNRQRLLRVFRCGILYMIILHMILFTSEHTRHLLGHIDADGTAFAPRNPPQMPQADVGIAIPVVPVGEQRGGLPCR